MFLLKNKDKPKENLQVNKGEIAFIKAKFLFSAGDLIVYATLLICLLLSFVLLVLPRQNIDTDGFIITHENKTVFTFTFSKSEPLEIDENFVNLTQVKKLDDGYEITVYVYENKMEYNVIFIDTQNLTAKVIDSNCSERKDCYHAPAIKNNGTIYCNPHNLLIKPLSLKSDTPIAG